MDPSRPSGRRVFVLGRSADLDVEREAMRAIADHVELVLLSFGFPVSAAQDAVVQDALRFAAERGLWLDAALVVNADDVADRIRSTDDVTVVAAGGERRRLEGMLPSRNPHPHVLREAPGSGKRQPGPVAGVLGRRPRRRRGRDGPTGPQPDDPLHDGRVRPVEDWVTGGSESVEALVGRRDIPQPVIQTVWTREDALARKVGRLIVYLGAAPGVGKTYAMLGEGQRAKARGTDVVVGVVQTYGRPRTREMQEGLEVVQPTTIDYRGTAFEEMDAEAVIARRPERVLIDELAHTNVPGSRRAKRWEDVLDVLAEGITVITTLNVQHLASLNDVVAEVTGVRQQETVPDWILDLADQVELVDMSPHALRRRMVHGNVYPDPSKAELALQRFFTTENLTALRELALMRVANQVDDELLQRWSKAGGPETRERILVCVSRPGVSDELIRRGARIASRTRGDLLVVHATTGSVPDSEWLERTESLVRELGGEFHVLRTEDEPVERILSYAYQQHVTQILVGESLRSRWQEALRGSFVARLIRKASNVDVHVIARRER